MYHISLLGGDAQYFRAHFEEPINLALTKKASEKFVLETETGTETDCLTASTTSITQTIAVPLTRRQFGLQRARELNSLLRHQKVLLRRGMI